MGTELRYTPGRSRSTEGEMPVVTYMTYYGEKENTCNYSCTYTRLILE